MDPKALGLDLTREQALLIIRTWHKEDFNWLFKMGMSIYCEIFEIAPEAKKFFPYVVHADKSGKPYVDCTGFRRQALRFVQALSRVVVALEEEEQRCQDLLKEPPQIDVDNQRRNVHNSAQELTQHFASIGKKHRKFATDRNFKPELWQVFQSSMTKVMRDELERNPSLDAQEKVITAQGWNVVADYIIKEMEKGFSGKTEIVEFSGCCARMF